MAEIVTLEGFQYLGGDTSGFKGPYIWKKTKKKNYNIRLPEGTEKYSVYWMYGFISRSWMAYISLNRLGTGGWADENNELYCVAKTNRKRMLSSSFWMNFLKHEAQHSWDLNHIKGITGGQLEYRAKLVELIYSKKTLKTFYKFLLEANKSDTENTHCIASFRLIQDLSKKIFDREYEDDINIWKKHKKEIRLASSTLLNQDTSILI